MVVYVVPRATDLYCSAVFVSRGGVAPVGRALCLSRSCRLANGVRVLVVSCKPCPGGGAFVCWTAVLGGGGVRGSGVDALGAGRWVGDVEDVVMREWCVRGLYYVGVVVFHRSLWDGSCALDRMCLFPDTRVALARPVRLGGVAGWVSVSHDGLCALRCLYRSVFRRSTRFGARACELSTVYGSIVLRARGVALRGVRDVDSMMRYLRLRVGCDDLDPVLHACSCTVSLGRRVDVDCVERALWSMLPRVWGYVVPRVEDDVAMCHLRVGDVPCFVEAFCPYLCRCVVACPCFKDVSCTLTVCYTGAVSVRLYWGRGAVKPLWSGFQCVCVCGVGVNVRGRECLQSVCETLVAVLQTCV